MFHLYINNFLFTSDSDHNNSDQTYFEFLIEYYGECYTYYQPYFYTIFRTLFWIHIFLLFAVWFHYFFFREENEEEEEEVEIDLAPQKEGFLSYWGQQFKFIKQYTKYHSNHLYFKSHIDNMCSYLNFYDDSLLNYTNTEIYIFELQLRIILFHICLSFEITEDVDIEDVDTDLTLQILHDELIERTTFDIAKLKMVKKKYVEFARTAFRVEFQRNRLIDTVNKNTQFIVDNIEIVINLVNIVEKAENKEEKRVFSALIDHWISLLTFEIEIVFRGNVTLWITNDLHDKYLKHIALLKKQVEDLEKAVSQSCEQLENFETLLDTLKKNKRK